MNPRRVSIPGFKPVVNHKGAESAVEEIAMSNTMNLDDLVQARTQGISIDYAGYSIDQLKQLLIAAYGDEEKVKSFCARVEDQLNRVKQNDRPAMRRSRYVSRLNMQLDAIIEEQQPDVELPSDLEGAINALKAMDVAGLRKVIKQYPELGLSLELMTPEDVVNQLIVHLAEQLEQKVAAANDEPGVDATEEIVAAANDVESDDEAFDFTEGESLVTTVEDEDSDEDENSDHEYPTEENLPAKQEPALGNDSENFEFDESRDESEDDSDDEADDIDDEADDIDDEDVADLVQSAGSADDLIEIMSNFSDIAPEVTDENFVIYQSSLVRSIENAAYVGQSFFDGVISGLNLALSGPVHDSEFVQSKPVSMTAKARLVVVASLADVHELHENRAHLWNIPVAVDGFAPESLNFYHSVRGLSQDARPSHKRYGALSNGLRATFEELQRFNNRELLIAGPMSTIPETLEVVGSSLADTVADLFIEGLFGIEDIPMDMTIGDFVQVSSQTDLDDEGNVIFTVYTAMRTPMMFAESTRSNLYKALLSLSDDHAVEVTLIIAGNSRDAMFNRNLIDNDDVYDLSLAYGDGDEYTSENFTLSELENLSAEVHEAGDLDDEDDFDADEFEVESDDEDSDDEDQLDDEEMGFGFDTSILPIETESVAPWGEDVFAIIAVEHQELDVDNEDDEDDQVE